MLAAQMAAIHTATMTFARRLAMVRAARHAPRDVGTAWRCRAPRLRCSAPPYIIW